jgi:hypothetical protein
VRGLRDAADGLVHTEVLEACGDHAQHLRTALDEAAGHRARLEAVLLDDRLDGLARLG